MSKGEPRLRTRLRDFRALVRYMAIACISLGALSCFPTSSSAEPVEVTVPTAGIDWLHPSNLLSTSSDTSVVGAADERWLVIARNPDRIATTVDRGKTWTFPVFRWNNGTSIGTEGYRIVVGGDGALYAITKYLKVKRNGGYTTVDDDWHVWKLSSDGLSFDLVFTSNGNVAGPVWDHSGRIWIADMASSQIESRDGGWDNAEVMTLAGPVREIGSMRGAGALFVLAGDTLYRGSGDSDLEVVSTSDGAVPLAQRSPFVIGRARNGFRFSADDGITWNWTNCAKLGRGLLSEVPGDPGLLIGNVCGFDAFLYRISDNEPVLKRLSPRPNFSLLSASAAATDGGLLMAGDTGVFWYEGTTASWRAVEGTPENDNLKVVARINQYRLESGSPAATVSAAIGVAAANHAKYLKRNGWGDDAHSEVEGLPLFTGISSGDRCAFADAENSCGGEVISSVGGTGGIDDLMNTVYHRTLLLWPASSMFGASGAFGDTVADLPSWSGQFSFAPVIYPPSGTYEGPLSFNRGETPDPLEECPGFHYPVGAPISIWSPQSREGNIDVVEGRARKPVRGCSITDFGTAYLVPKEPLKPGTKYSASFSGFGSPEAEEYSWSFTTAGNAPRSRAKIKVKVNGPKKARKGKKATYKVRIKNSGKAKAKRVKLRVKGRGIKAKKWVGKIAAGRSKTVKVKLRFKRGGKIKTTFKVTSKNAGKKKVRKRVSVR